MYQNSLRIAREGPPVTRAHSGKRICCATEAAVSGVLMPRTCRLGYTASLQGQGTHLKPRTMTFNRDKGTHSISVTLLPLNLLVRGRTASQRTYFRGWAFQGARWVLQHGVCSDPSRACRDPTLLTEGSAPHNWGKKGCDDQSFHKYRFCFQNIQEKLALKSPPRSTSETQKDQKCIRPQCPQICRPGRTGDQLPLVKCLGR